MATVLQQDPRRMRTLPIGGEMQPNEATQPRRPRAFPITGQPQASVQTTQRPQPSIQREPMIRADTQPLRPMPIQPMQPLTPAAPGVSSTALPITQFTADQNLRSTQINPVASADTQTARALALQALQGLADTPYRADLANQAFQLIMEQNADARRLGTQQIGRDAARLGRIGSGMVTTSLGDLESRIRQSEDQAARALALDAAGSTMADRQAALQALLGGAGAFDAWDRADRGELRTERGRQDQLAQQAINNFIQQQMLQDALLGSAFNRQMAVNQMLSQIGYGGGNPAGSFLTASQQAGQGAAGSAAGVGQLLQMLALQQALGGGTSGGTGAVSEPVFGNFG